MSSLIVAETCPPPECNLSPRDVEALLDELKLYLARYGPAFRRLEQFLWTRVYLKGLLGDEPLKID